MTPDAIIAAAARIQLEWGDGYRVERAEGDLDGSCTLHVVHFDGSRFTVSADRWGNPIETDDGCRCTTVEGASSCPVHDIGDPDDLAYDNEPDNREERLYEGRGR